MVVLYAALTVIGVCGYCIYKGYTTDISLSSLTNNFFGRFSANVADEDTIRAAGERANVEENTVSTASTGTDPPDFMTSPLAGSPIVTDVDSVSFRDDTLVRISQQSPDEVTVRDHDVIGEQQQREAAREHDQRNVSAEHGHSAESGRAPQTESNDAFRNAPQFIDGVSSKNHISRSTIPVEVDDEAATQRTVSDDGNPPTVVRLGAIPPGSKVSEMSESEKLQKAAEEMKKSATTAQAKSVAKKRSKEKKQKQKSISKSKKGKKSESNKSRSRRSRSYSKTEGTSSESSKTTRRSDHEGSTARGRKSAF